MDSPLPDLSAFERIVFFTGAGISADAGIPTYRGEGGIWSQYDWRRDACQEAFESDPDRVLDFHDVRRTAVASVAPTRGHRIIAQVMHDKPETRVVTQNIDGLHQQAGAESVLEFHGSLWRLRCDCHPEGAPDRTVPIAPRRCDTCGAWRRPDIVWFGDALDPARIDEALDVIAGADLFIGIGTSAVVYPAAVLPRIAAQSGTPRIEINPEETPLSSWYTHHLRTTASEGLATLWRDPLA